MENNLTPKQELDHILSTTDISNIEQIQFTPTDGTMFSSKNENVMKIALYISNSLGKKTFLPLELKNAFEFIIKNLDSHLSRDEYTNIVNAIEGFISTGGSIEIIEKSLEETKEFITPPMETSPNQEKIQSSPTLSNWDDIKSQSKLQDEKPSIPSQVLQTSEKKEKVMTWKNVLLAIFVIGPISGIITSIIMYPLSTAIFSIGSYNTATTIIGLISFVTSPVLFVLLSEQFLKLSRKGSIILLIVTTLISFGIFAAVCGGILFMFF
ncbi:hypothetical protein KBC86_03385 [Candidatus Gracilibacteria bacterium]|nr:hypothetical protein [Candidatus Gracilibacteria bacterium]